MTLELKNIGMIKEASVKIDGLTVIAGENDTGKSTLGKALYLMIKSRNKSFLSNLITEHSLDILIIIKIRLMMMRIFKFNALRKDAYMAIDTNRIFSKKMSEHVGWSYKGKSTLEEIDSIFIETPLVWNFTDFFRDIAQVESQMDIKLDYPYLMKDLNFKLHIKSALDGLDIKEKVTSLMGGEFKKDEMGRYYFDKQGQRIELVNTATGIKYFGIFQILSQNNYLNENTILVLDEPEVHLHPKWQLEMAKIIIELIKYGVKIVVNSHSPYMIEALELYSSKQKINNNFYLAEKKDDYSTIIDVTANLEPIYSKLAKPIQDLEEESLENFKW